MNGVIGMNELLLETPLDEEQRTYAQQVSRSSEHMLAIINDILDISTMETGRLELDEVAFDLRDTVEQACAPADLEARAKGIELRVQIDGDVPRRVNGDGSRLRQVLMNLASNAVKFTSAGSVDVHLSRSEPQGDGILFEVSDTGIGIDAPMLERMFEPFTQADVSTTRIYGGNGLGLAIAKELVELMGGTIGAESEPGQGSRFWFELTLPSATGEDGSLGESVEEPVVRRIEAPVVDASAVPAGRSGTPAAPGGARDRGLVLVVEDSEVNRIVAGRVLERSGFRAHLVDNANEALRALSVQHYDAVLMDCQMPGMDGYEATRELRSSEGADGRHTPVIAMTAHAMTGDRERCLEAGMDDYITKPVRSHTLVEVLGRWVPATSAADDLAGDDAAHPAALNSAA